MNKSGKTRIIWKSVWDRNRLSVKNTSCLLQTWQGFSFISRAIPFISNKGLVLLFELLFSFYFSTCSDMFQNVRNSPNCPDWSKLVQNGPKRSKMVQKFSRWNFFSEMVQNSLKSSKYLKIIQWDPKES